MPEIAFIAMHFVRDVSIWNSNGLRAARLTRAPVTKTAMTKGNYENEETDRRMKATTPWGDWGNAADVAKAAVFLATDDAAWVTGVGLPVDGGYLAQ